MNPVTLFLDIVAACAGIAIGIPVLALSAAALLALYGKVAEQIPKRPG